MYYEVIEKNRKEFDALSINQEFLADWNMRALVEQVKDKLGPLGEGRKYHFIIPDVLADEYGVSNFQTVPLYLANQALW